MDEIKNALLYHNMYMFFLAKINYGLIQSVPTLCYYQSNWAIVYLYFPYSFTLSRMVEPAGKYIPSHEVSRLQCGTDAGAYIKPVSFLKIWWNLSYVNIHVTFTRSIYVNHSNFTATAKCEPIYYVARNRLIFNSNLA